MRNKVGVSLPISANDKVRERVDEYLLFSAFRDILILCGKEIEKCGTILFILLQIQWNFHKILLILWQNFCYRC